VSYVEDFRRTFEELRRLGGENLKLQEYDSAVEYYLKALDMLEVRSKVYSLARIC
jgi:hypothetical protein